MSGQLVPDLRPEGFQAMNNHHTNSAGKSASGFFSKLFRRKVKVSSNDFL